MGFTNKVREIFGSKIDWIEPKRTREIGLEGAIANSEPNTSPAKVVAVLASKDSHLDVEALARSALTNRVFLISDEVIPSWNIKDSKIVYHQAISLGQINWVLKLVGPVDEIIDIRESSESQDIEYWKRLFFHLRNGGQYSVFSTARPSRIFELFSSASKEFQSKGSRGVASELGESIGELNASGEKLVITKSGDHFVKHRHVDASRFLAARSNGLLVEELTRIKGQTFKSRAVVTSHDAAVEIDYLNSEFKVPELQLRKYKGKIGIISNSLIISDLDIIPDSFKFPLASNLNNVNLINVNAEFARVPSKLIPKKTLEGSFYHIDSSNSGHFGHLMGEVLACLWGWPQAKAEDPSLKVIFRIRFPNERIPAIELALFQAFGILRDDIVWTDEPVWVSSLVAAAPMWQNQIPHYVHPEIEKTWSKISENLINGNSSKRSKVFISRASNLSDRSCRNIRQVEEYFASNGFEILYPERFDLGEQAAIFHNAEAIAGFGGSGLFNIIHSRNLKNLIVLNQEAYTARNEHLFASVIGCNVDYFWSTPDISHPKGAWSQEAYVSAWEFDFARNLSSLDELMKKIN